MKTIKSELNVGRTAENLKGINVHSEEFSSEVQMAFDTTEMHVIVENRDIEFGRPGFIAYEDFATATEFRIFIERYEEDGEEYIKVIDIQN